jgi:DNA mismatch endonuclease, patch repair protein
MDRVSITVRSQIMASVGSAGNRTTEMRMASLLRSSGLSGYRKQWHVRGKPDFAWPGVKIALFVDGCFWHGCPHCRRASKSNRKFWRQKVVNNQARDRRVAAFLRRRGWKVLRVWECAVTESRTVRRIERALLQRLGGN